LLAMVPNIDTLTEKRKNMRACATPRQA